MADLQPAMAEILDLLGGATKENAELLMTAVAMHIRSMEGMLLRQDEATAVRSEITSAVDYPVPEELLPTRPLAFPGPPSELPYFAYHCLVSVINTRLRSDTRPFRNIPDFPAREARTLEAFRNIRQSCRAALVEILRVSQQDNSASSPTSPASLIGPQRELTVAFESLTVAPVVLSKPTDIWDLHQGHAHIRRLILRARLLNARTVRVPPITLDCLVLDFTVRRHWSSEGVAATLAMLASSLIPALTFENPPSYVIRDFFAQGPEVEELQYRFDGTCVTVVLDSLEHTGPLEQQRARRSTAVTFSNVDTTADSAIFAPAVFHSVRSFAITDRMRAAAIPLLAHVAPDGLSRVCIGLEDHRGQLPTGQASLLAYRGPRMGLFANVAELQLVRAAHASSPSSGPLVVQSGVLDDFITSAFSHVPHVEAGSGLVLV
ncbi:hypothetical protein AURDEDRAFT_166032 [Auricularia subglabra TFB-10046 SS5]|nr:hypothetical protein AURDEDRAFT_166032 [Auricularia subglabra TFB-10046 SS5]